MGVRAQPYPHGREHNQYHAAVGARTFTRSPYPVPISRRGRGPRSQTGAPDGRSGAPAPRTGCAVWATSGPLVRPNTGYPYS
ncbi:hypothetical protein GCM10010483_17800 [Actinokineospora diospyrosa]